MNQENPIAGRPSEEQLKSFANYGEQLPSPLDHITYSEIPEGWEATGEVRAKDEVYARIVNNSRADQLDIQHGADNWGVVEKSPDLVSVIAKKAETGESVSKDDEKELGKVALESTELPTQE